MYEVKSFPTYVIIFPTWLKCLSCKYFFCNYPIKPHFLLLLPQFMSNPPYNDWNMNQVFQWRKRSFWPVFHQVISLSELESSLLLKKKKFLIQMIKIWSLSRIILSRNKSNNDSQSIKVFRWRKKSFYVLEDPFKQVVSQVTLDWNQSFFEGKEVFHRVIKSFVEKSLSEEELSLSLKKKKVFDQSFIKSLCLSELESSLFWRKRSFLKFLTSLSSSLSELDSILTLKKKKKFLTSLSEL